MMNKAEKELLNKAIDRTWLLAEKLDALEGKIKYRMERHIRMADIYYLEMVEKANDEKQLKVLHRLMVKEVEAARTLWSISEKTEYSEFLSMFFLYGKKQEEE